MATILEKDQNEADFGNAFGEDSPEPTSQTDDDAFGITPPGAGSEDGAEENGEGPTGAAPSVAIMIGAGDSDEDESMYPQHPDEAIAASDEPNPAEAGHTMTAEDIQRETQRLKSWEGRLKARDAANGMSGAPDMQDSDPNEANESAAEEAGESPSQEAGEMEAEKLQGMDPDQALEALRADFGDEFVSMLEMIIDAKVGKASTGMKEDVDAIISDIVDTKTRNHFEKIAEKHPDFLDISESPGFKDWISNMPEEQKAEAERICDSGSAMEICALLSKYKSSAGQDSSMDAAEGVRSSGMRLPSQPGASGDYEAAWNEA